MTTLPTSSQPSSPGMSYGIAPAGFRLPTATRIGRVRLQVADLSRSLSYYQHRLGLQVMSQAADRAALGAPEAQRVLVELYERPGAHPVPRRGTLGLYHFAVLLPDRPALGRFVRHALGDPLVIGMADHAVSEAIYLTDPDGLGIEVYADRPRAAWRVGRNRELEITTEALDVESVLDAGAGERWMGMPSGTVMGHIHLHVGDLAQAEAFYHRGVGLDKIVWSYPGALFLSAGGYHHHLGTNTWSRATRPAEDQAQLLSWDIEVPLRTDADGVAGNLTRSGYTVAPDGDGWRTADPWGSVVRIVGGRSSP